MLYSDRRFSRFRTSEEGCCGVGGAMDGCRMQECSQLPEGFCFGNSKRLPDILLAPVLCLGELQICFLSSSPPFKQSYIWNPESRCTLPKILNVKKQRATNNLSWKQKKTTADNRRTEALWCAGVPCSEAQPRPGAVSVRGQHATSHGLVHPPCPPRLSTAGVPDPH